MFDELFTQPAKIEKYQAAPLAEHRQRYLRYLADSGARRSTLRKAAFDQVHLVRLLTLKEDDRVSVSRVEAAAKEWSRPRRHRLGQALPASPKSTTRFFGRSVQWLRFLGWLEEPAVAHHPHAAEVADYEAWMRGERGLSEGTIEGCCAAVHQFLGWLHTNDTPLRSARIGDIDRAIAFKHSQGHYSRVTIRIYAQRLRGFIRFCEDQGWSTPGMAAGLVPPRLYPDETVPKGLARKDVERLLATTEGDRPVDKRDRAILMLLIAYGLRAGEVRALKLDDLDWERETIYVHRSKVGRNDLYPLSRGVGQAILRYIVEARPSRPDRTLFLTTAAPIKPLSRGGFADVVRQRVERLGIVTGRRGV